MADTVGSLIDKISIVELKLFHMRDHMNHFRDALTEATEFGKLARLRDQRDALAAELTTLAANPPKPFPQFKMYNDPHYRTP